MSATTMSATVSAAAAAAAAPPSLAATVAAGPVKSTTTTTTTTGGLPPTGIATVKSVLSADTVVLLGRAVAGQVVPPETLFTMEGLLAPRLQGKNNPVDEPGAFPAREWLRRLLVGKRVKFVTCSAHNNRVYGHLHLQDETNVAVACCLQGHATPKAIKFGTAAAAADDDEAKTEKAVYEQELVTAYQTALEHKRGIHAESPLVRSTQQAGDDFVLQSLISASSSSSSSGRIQCVVEHVFDGSRMRVQVTDTDAVPNYKYAHFTVLLAGASAPRVGRPTADPPVPAEPCAEQARQFTMTRLLQRELPLTLLGTDKPGSTAVCVVHHPAGNIAVELLKVGLARMTDWTVRLLPVADVPALRFAENAAKRTRTGIWHNYQAPPTVSTSAVHGTVVEVVSGDTLLILASGKDYKAEQDLLKISLASVRAPRLGGRDRPDEAFAAACKERLRVLCVGKKVAVTIHYERDIPLSTEKTEKRSFGTVSVGKHACVAETLITEGLAVTQRHRDDDPTSPRYDELRAAEALAKAAGKGLHKPPAKSGGAPRSVIDLTEPRKAKAYSGSLMRAGTVKAVVDYVFNGALFKLLVPAENCFIRFAPQYIRCPQPSPSPGARQAKTAEPFGDDAKRHARLTVLQRNVEIICTGVTNSGIITGTLYMRAGDKRQDYASEILGAGLATLDQRKVEYGEVPKPMLDIQQKATENKMGIFSFLTRPTPAADTAPRALEKLKEGTVKVRLSEIRSGSRFYYHTVGDDAAKVIEDSMKLFTENNGTAGAPCDVKVGKVVAALFDDGNGKSWYRAKIVERKTPTKVSVLFLDHGNLATVPVSTHLRPLEMSLGTDRIPPVAKPAVLALTTTRSLETDEGVEAARHLQSLCWGHDLLARTLAPDESGAMAVVLYPGVSETDESVNAQLIAEGLARLVTPAEVTTLADRMLDDEAVTQLRDDLKASQESARKTRSGMWRYGDVGDDDEEN